MQATMQMSGNTVTFVPNNGTLVLQGAITPAGKINASLTLPGADRKSYQLVFQALEHPDATTIEGRYITPRCVYATTLHKLTR